MKRAIDRLEPFQRAISKAHLASAGVSLDALDHKPLIAIANSWNEICPGHEPLRKLAEEVKKGIIEAGGEPIEFMLSQVIPGWTEGVQLMSVGSKYRLFIPAKLGYGSRGAGQAIPPDAALIFDVELIAIV